MNAEPSVHIRQCPLCEAMCGLEVQVSRGRVEKIRANENDVWSRGYICPKGTTIGELHHDPDRLRTPLIREGSEHREATWDEAFAEIERRLRPVIDAHGMDAVTAYIGNPTAHNFYLGRYTGAFTAFSGIPRIYSAGTVDQWPKNVAVALLYGGMWTIPTPDLDRNDHLIVMGANPHASQGSLLAAADVLGRFDAIRKRGGKVVVIDPRRTGTVRHADEWIPIRPGTDALLLLAMTQVLFEEGRVDLAHLAPHVNGVEQVRKLCQDFAPEVVASSCAVPADTIRRLARELSDAQAGAVYGRIGTCNQEFGTLASWAVEVVNVLTGKLDRPGGSMFANPVAAPLAALPHPDYPNGEFTFGRWRSRVRNAPEVLGQVPVSCLAEEIATPGPGQIRALITIAGNPVISAPDAAKLDAALPELDCMVSVDNWVNETSRHAHVILPGRSAFEQPHFDDLLLMWAVRNAGKYSKPIFPPPAGPDEGEILLTLAALCAGQKASEIDARALDQLYFAGLVAAIAGIPGSRIEGRDPAEIVAATPGDGAERILDFQIRIGPWGDAYGANPGGLTLASFEAEPNGLDMGPLEPRIPEVLGTPTGKIELAPPYITADLPRLLGRIGREEPGLVLVSRRHLRSNNSWMHNVASLMTGRDRCTLLMHPDDAERCGVRDGATARISSASGALEAPVEVSDEMMPGVVCLPHGWGHDKPGARLSVAAGRPGVCNNDIAPGELVDEISGNAVVNGIPVEVAPVS